jgi:hypothetical protein
MKDFIITPNDFDLNTDSENIQQAINEAKRTGVNQIVIPRINKKRGSSLWVIDKTIRLPSDIEVVLDNCFMQMADDVVGGFFCSETLFTPEGTSLAHRLKNIHIRGLGSATLDGGRPTGLSEKTQAEYGMPVRLNTPVFFMNVEGFSVENIRITNHRYWGMRFEFCSRGVIRDMYFEGHCDSKNQDGINLRNGCNHILIENIFGQTGDDMIALSAIDHDTKIGFNADYPLIVQGHDWDIHDVTIRNISGSAIHHPLIAMRNHNGAKLYNIVIDNVRDTEQLYPAIGEERFNYERYSVVTIGSPNYALTQNQIGDTYNISISNVYAAYSAKAIFLACSLRNSTIRNVFASGLCRHVVSVLHTDGWDMKFAGVKIENVLLDGIYHTPAEKKDTWSLDFSIMRDEDYIKNLVVSNVFTENTSHFAEIAENISDKADIKLLNANIDTEEAKEIKKVRKTRVYSTVDP